MCRGQKPSFPAFLVRGCLLRPPPALSLSPHRGAAGALSCVHHFTAWTVKWVGEASTATWSNLGTFTSVISNETVVLSPSKKSNYIFANYINETCSLCLRLLPGIWEGQSAELPEFENRKQEAFRDKRRLLLRERSLGGARQGRGAAKHKVLSAALPASAHGFLLMGQWALKQSRPGTSASVCLPCLIKGSPWVYFLLLWCTFDLSQQMFII